MTRTRFAPSPTGQMHIGNLRTAVYAYAMARHDNGRFILRIEDTDVKRNRSGGIEEIQDTLKLFGLDWDEFYVQSQRKQEGIYRKAADKLLSSGHAFYCDCPARESDDAGYSKQLRDPCREKHLTSGAVKLMVPEGETVSYYDFVIEKEVSWNTDTVYDATLLKSDGYPTYHLAAMTDDLEMHVTHILRGHDWMPSTPIHLLIFKYLGGDMPHIGHLTDILSPQGGKLSKRRDSVFCESFLKEGYLPEALLNFIILLGWAPKDNRELFTLDEFVQYFDPKGFQKANPLFLPDKLDWFNGQYIRQKTDTELTQMVKQYVKNKITDNKLEQITALIKDRMVKLTDFPALTLPLVSQPEIEISLFEKPEMAVEYLSHALDWIRDRKFSAESLETGWTDDIKSRGWKVGDYFMALRIAVYGSRFTPPVTDTMLVLGREESVSRIRNAVKLLN